MPEISAIAALALKSDKTQRLFASVGSSLIRGLADPAKSAAIKVLASFEGYGSYLEETNERVSTFRSFANPTNPVDLLSHFVSMDLKKNENGKPINQDDLLQRLQAPSRFVVSATAGHGKSMLTKFMALSMFEHPRGRIPIFIELRELNRITSPRLLSYISTVYTKGSSISEQAFVSGLKSGVFCLILDAFDELNHDIRASIEDQILTLAREFKALSIIVSGRPDDKFQSWKTFHHYKICPMTQSRVIELIDKLDYDNGIKKRFKAKIKNGLYNSHKSFLSTPLLAILMLLTFEENANIPDKMHLFYAKAFETLFHKHDATKEQYDRSRKSKLQIDDFARMFSVFCLNTYVKEKVEFNRSEIAVYIANALKYSKLDVSSDNVLSDLEEAVCLLQREGFSYFFVHRSFQEYFTAVFLANCPPKVRDDFIDSVTVRYWDSVLPMLFDMAADQLEPSWVRRNIDAYLGQFTSPADELQVLKARWKGLSVIRRENRVTFHGIQAGSSSSFLSILNRFYRPRFEQFIGRQIDEVSEELAAKYIPTRQVVLSSNDEPAVELLEFEFDTSMIELLPKAKFIEWALQEKTIVEGISASIDESQADKNSFLERLFREQPA